MNAQQAVFPDYGWSIHLPKKHAYKHRWIEKYHSCTTCTALCLSPNIHKTHSQNLPKRQGGSHPSPFPTSNFPPSSAPSSAPPGFPPVTALAFEQVPQRHLTAVRGRGGRRLRGVPRHGSARIARLDRLGPGVPSGVADPPGWGRTGGVGAGGSWRGAFGSRIEKFQGCSREQRGSCLGRGAGKQMNR